MPHCNKKMISFFLTTKSNICCRYCYNVEERSRIEERTLPFHIAKAGIDWYFLSQSSRHIRFYGPGEPTREFELMKEITKYAKDQDARVTVELQTNGVFTQEVRNWLLENANIIWMSFDGARDIQDYYRPINLRYAEEFGSKASSEILEDNVKWLIGNSKQRNLMVGARATITNENVNRQVEMVNYFASLGIRYIWNDPLFNSVGEKPIREIDGKKTIDLDNYIEQYALAKEYAEKMGVFYGSFLAVNFVGESEYHCRACTPLCAPHITPDGYISACDMVVVGEKPYHMEPFIVGKYSAETASFVIDMHKIRLLEKRKSSNITHCSDCPVKLHCGGYCLGETVNETGKLDGQDALKCEAIKKLYERIGSCNTYTYLHP